MIQASPDQRQTLVSRPQLPAAGCTALEHIDVPLFTNSARLIIPDPSERLFSAFLSVF
jgi:hypothetical protein